ncbi:hypothetical protein SK128_018967 [Halocaridina rubra]|uniref:Uncharacterized protein n=1 Tax=Halocaridina rubra TaxID=373956 RepID=A0AAN8ZNJ6_HALRR
MRSKIEEEEMDTRYEDKDDDNISDDDQNMDDDNDDADNDDSDTDGMDNQDDDNDDLYPEENMLGSQKRNYIDEVDPTSRFSCLALGPGTELPR